MQNVTIEPVEQETAPPLGAWVTPTFERVALNEALIGTATNIDLDGAS